MLRAYAILGAERVDLHRMVDHEVDRHQRIDPAGIASAAGDRGAQRGQIDHRRHAGEILHHHARGHERQLALRSGARPGRQRAHILLGDVLAAGPPQQVLEQHAHRVGQLQRIDDAVEPVERLPPGSESRAANGSGSVMTSDPYARGMAPSDPACICPTSPRRSRCSSTASSSRRGGLRGRRRLVVFAQTLIPPRRTTPAASFGALLRPLPHRARGRRGLPGRRPRARLRRPPDRAAGLGMRHCPSVMEGPASAPPARPALVGAPPRAARRGLEDLLALPPPRLENSEDGDEGDGEVWPPLERGFRKYPHRATERRRRR